MTASTNPMKTHSNPDKTSSTPEAQLRSFSARLSVKQQRLVSSVRSALRRRFPTCNEIAYDYSSFFVIGYSPTDRGIDSIVSIAARADRVELYFNHGPELPDPKKLLKGSGKLTRFIQLDSARQLANTDVKRFIAGSVELSSIPLPSKGKGTLIIKTNKSGASKKKKSRRASPK